MSKYVVGEDSTINRRQKVVFDAQRRQLVVNSSTNLFYVSVRGPPVAKNSRSEKDHQLRICTTIYFSIPEKTVGPLV